MKFKIGLHLILFELCLAYLSNVKMKDHNIFDKNINNIMHPISPQQIETIVLNNMGLVHHVVKKHYNPNYYNILNDYQDLVQIAMIAMMKSVYKFNPDKKCSFSTFSYLCMKRDLQQYLKFVNKSNKLKNKLLIKNLIISDYNNQLPENYIFNKQLNENLNYIINYCNGYDPIKKKYIYSKIRRCNKLYILKSFL